MIREHALRVWKGEGAVVHSTISRCFKKIPPSYEGFDDQAKSGRPETVDSESIEANPASFPRKVSGELDILQSSVDHHLHDYGKHNKNYPLVPHVTKILQNFWLA